MAEQQKPIAVGPGAGPHMMGPIRKPKNAKKTIRRILRYLMVYKLQLVLIAVGILISSGAGVAGTYFLKPLINNYIVPLIGKQNPDLSGFIRLLTVMGAIYVLGIASAYMYGRLMIHVSTNTLKKIRIDLFTHMQSLPIRYFDKHTHGELMSRYSNDTDAMREMLGQSIPQIISSAITIVGVFVMMLVLSPILTLLVVVMLFVMFTVIKKIGGKSAAFFGKQQKELGKVNGYIEEMIEGQKVVKVFVHENASKEKFDGLNENLRDAAKNAHTFANILMPIMGNLSYVHYALTAMLGAIIAINSENPLLYLGTIASFLQYTRSFSMPLIQSSQQINSVLSALAGAERIFEVLDEPVETDEGYVTLVNAMVDESGNIRETTERTGTWAWKYPQRDGSLTYTLLKGDVRFEDVTFSYEPGKTVLKDVNLYAKPGQKIAFVGSTGAGKTTITNLINRFYDVPDGNILYDGININIIKKDDLRRSLAMVLQDTHLFTGTVMENIRYGKLDASDEDVIAAAKLANAHFFISHLPQGYDTVLTSDGINLSQGQRQLIAIARAAIADPPVLILDEATSSIDTRTEALIEKGMDKLMDGRTVFVIAHRLSTVRNAKAIMVLENGEIIERGNHDGLIAQKGKYYQLYTGAFELS
ncbi:MAG: ABC transporter ATP-binding protein [Christensenellales bacterium]